MWRGEKPEQGKGKKWEKNQVKTEGDMRGNKEGSWSPGHQLS